MRRHYPPVDWGGDALCQVERSHMRLSDRSSIAAMLGSAITRRAVIAVPSPPASGYCSSANWQKASLAIMFDKNVWVG